VQIRILSNTEGLRAYAGGQAMRVHLSPLLEVAPYCYGRLGLRVGRVRFAIGPTGIDGHGREHFWSFAHGFFQAGTPRGLQSFGKSMTVQPAS
jgi:hypothetical protein